jgi:apolipoprotein N-acyltransferase
MLHGIIGYGTTLYWLFHLFGAAAIALFAIMALFTAFFCLLFNFFSKQTKSAALKVLLAATLWTAMEFYRSELFFLRFPWITPGSALGPTFLSPILGVYGTSFLVIAACGGFMHRRTVPLAFLLSLCTMCLGLFHPGRVEPDKEGSIAVTVVQSEDCKLQSYVALTRTAHKASSDLVVWPEYSLPYDVRKNVDDFAILTNLCAEMDAVLVVGTQTIVGPGDKDWHNTALVLDKHGVLGEYYKARPVHFFNDGIPGRKFNPVQTDLGAFGTPICFDCDYSEVARQMVKLGAEYLVVPSFDAESWSANQHFQHALLFRLRAAENARWLACAASSGVSQVIDPHGNVHRSLPPMETGVLTYRIGRTGGRTVFNRVGWLFPWLTLGCSAILLAYGAIRFIATRRTKAQPGAEADTATPRR